MKLHYFGLAAVGLAISACGLRDDANIGNETNQPIDSDGSAAGSGAGGATHGTGGATHATGGATQGNGGATQNTGGATHATGGATQGNGGATQNTGGATHATGGSTGGGPKCGSKTCPSGEVCCNASCGVCTPPGYACDAIACVPDPVPVDAGPPRHCVDIVACVSGDMWSPTECKCVPTTGGSCTTASDCHLVSDYCGGCNCLSLSNGQKEPACASTPVSCLIDPCQLKSAACVSGRCVAQ